MDLISFLKTHSKINNDFIEDFFSFYDRDNKYNFCVDLDKIAKFFLKYGINEYQVISVIPSGEGKNIAVV